MHVNGLFFRKCYALYNFKEFYCSKYNNLNNKVLLDVLNFVPIVHVVQGITPICLVCSLECLQTLWFGNGGHCHTSGL